VGMADIQEHARTDTDYADRLINEQEAAAFLGFSVRALQNWRLRGGGPEYVRVSRRSVRYRRGDLNRWADARLEAHTSASYALISSEETGGVDGEGPESAATTEQGPTADTAGPPADRVGPEPDRARAHPLRTLLPHDRD
jgi:predicted DNA-binding transcriptional regulator AlpA